MNASTPRVSAADVFPSGAAPQPPLGDDHLLSGIQAMLDGCGTSDRNALVIIAIEALIDGGVNTRPRIVGAARSLGFKPAHAGAVLDSSEGTNRLRHRWQRGADGVYAVLAAAAQAA